MRLLAAIFVALIGSMALAQKAVEPKAGSAERKAIMDALRVPFEKEIGGKLIFKVSWLRAAGGWAYAQFAPLRPGGKPVDWRKTKFKEEFEQGVLDSTSIALLQKTSGKWKVVRYAIGPTDYPVEYWLEKLKGVPKSIFPHGG